jgi:Fe-S-cluster-containing hydrogenase component 2
MPGLTVTVTDRCIGCGTCTQGVCFVDAIQLENGRAVISDECRGCGRCANICSQQAIEIDVPDTSVSKSYDEIASLVNVN